MKDEYIKKFYNEVCNNMEGDHKIILEPGRVLKDDWIEYDQVKWELEKPIQDLVNKLLKENTLDLEDKILEIYKYICLNYIYDDNVLFFFRKDETDPENIKYIAVDWYGRIIGEKCKENRKNHNRRVCYEFARFYAKAINELLEGTDNSEAFMLGEKDNTHYVTALTGNDYSIVLDVDDFNQIKDLTRLKLGLTIKGIKILRDESGKFQKAVDKFNKDRLEDLIETQKAKENLRVKNTIEYFNRVVDILKTYNLDSQGFMEYMRTIVANEEIEIEIIWRAIENGIEKRHVRCLLFELDEKTYLIDSVEQNLREINKETIDTKLFIFKPEENEYPYYGG